ncbi:MAG: NUDIX hydrolase [Cellvibrionaceae bacterium]
MSPPSPSSTVMLLRDARNGGIEALLVQRNSELKTGGGAWVFPGGRVDPLDYDETDDHFLAAQNAAVRETFEETAVVLSRDALTPFAHWTTPPGPTRRFATWFFLAHARNSPVIQVDGGEIVDYQWLTPQAALQAQRAGHITIMPPTFVSLNLLDRYQNCMDAVAGFSECEVQHFNPRIHQTERGRIILYDDDAAYDGTDLDVPGRRHRVFIEGNEWCYECT